MENKQSDSAGTASLRSFTLDNDVVVAGQVTHRAGTEITVRKPAAGELRGLTMMSLSQLDYTAVETLAPRITSPVLHKQDVAGMDPADLMQLGGEIMDFLLPKAARPESLPG
ncbi:MAG TPA: phage tail assembly protein [Allosphingosinicella sp.]|uniref:phage tail assembly protein n=1 Tax=Allosphingosinicella sp. TaxID=2823234 RepID=UPI002ED9BCF4